jgi:hypothetical protein
MALEANTQQPLAPDTLGDEPAQRNQQRVMANPQPLRVLYVAAELFPWVKSGGLGDVTAALPWALSALGIDVRLLLPGFAGFLDAFPGIADAVRLGTPFAADRVRIGLARIPGSTPLAYLVDLPAFYDRPGNPYAGPDGRDWPDNHRRFGLFGWVAAELARGADPGSWPCRLPSFRSTGSNSTVQFLSSRPGCSTPTASPR